MTEHLDEAGLEAVAHGRNDLVGDDMRLHIARCDTCQDRVLEVREVSREVSFSFAAEVPDFGDLDAMIATALEKAPAQAPAYARPSLATLVGALILGVAATGVLALLSRPSLTAVVDFVRGGFTLASGLDQVVAAFVPGGWGLVAVVGFLMLAAVAVPLRRLVLAGGLDASPVLSVFLTLSAVFFSLGVSSGGAQALSFEGAWASPDEGHLVTLAVTDEALNVALREAAASAGLAYVSQLEASERRVTLDVQGAELRLVLETLLGDAPVVAQRTETALVLSPAPAAVVAAEGAEGAEGEGTDGAAPTALETPETPEAPEAAEPPEAPATPEAPIVPRRPRGLHDRESFGGDVHIGAGEQVRNVTSTGGDVVIEGMVWGTVTSMGGDIEVEDGGVVHGQLVSMGGDIEAHTGATVLGEMVAMGGEVEVEDGANVGGAWGLGAVDDDVGEGDIPLDEDGNISLHFGPDDRDDDDASSGFGGWLEDALRGAASHALLFVFGVLLLTLVPARLDALRRTLVRAPLRSVAVGLLGIFGAAVTFVVLLVTILGIPAAVVLFVLSIVGGYVGLLASASVLGAALPAAKLKGQPVLQVGAGVAVLYLASLVPVLGSLLTIAAVLAGFGAILMTRFEARAVGD